MKTKTFQRFLVHNRPARNSLLVLLSTITFAGATIIRFELSPTGSPATSGLSPANEVPVAGASTGSGNAISGGITFDTSTSTLSFTMGYGSAAGYANLTGAATALHIHGPAAAGVNGPVLFDLATVHFPAVDATKGGVIYGSVVYPAPAADSLLAGLNYVNIHTILYPGGEIRGQLVRVNSAPDIVCPADATAECGVEVVYSAAVSDIDGDAVQVTWTVNGVPVETDNLAAGGPPSSGVVTYKAALPDGVNTLGLIATDSDGNITTCEATITVVDTLPPVIVSASSNPKVLWPPNHKMIPVTVHAKVTDLCGPAKWKILSVKSNQAVDAKGSGNTAPDWKITGNHTVSLRSERTGKDKGGRIYTITVQATDEAGNRSAPSQVRVTVPHDQSGK